MFVDQRDDAHHDAPRHQHRAHMSGLVEYGLTSHSTQYRSFGDDIFTGHVTQPTVSKH